MRSSTQQVLGDGVIRYVPSLGRETITRVNISQHNF